VHVFKELLIAVGLFVLWAHIPEIIKVALLSQEYFCLGLFDTVTKLNILLAYILQNIHVNSENVGSGGGYLKVK